jgi:hypothetical protein
MSKETSFKEQEKIRLLRLKCLQQEIQKGLDSGTGGALDMALIKEKAKAKARARMAGK